MTIQYIVSHADSIKFVVIEKRMFIHFPLKGNFAIFYMLAKYVPGDIKYIHWNVWNLSNLTHQGTKEICLIVQNVGILGFTFS